MKLKGHLSEYPLRELLTILRNRCETGRLQLGYKRVPGLFHLKDGNILGARIGPLKGLDAVRVALLMEEAPFDFDDAVTIELEANINESDHRQIVTRLLRLPLHDGEELETIPLPMAVLVDTDGIRPSGTNGWPVSGNFPGHILPIAKEALIFIQSHIRVVSIAVVLMLFVPIVIAIAVTFPGNDGPRAAVLAPETDPNQVGPANPQGSRTKQVDRSALPVDDAVFTDQKPIANQEPTAEIRRVPSSFATAEMSSNQEPALRSDQALPKETSARVIAVVLQIEEGRISEAYVKDHHPGLEAFEAAAIRLARQRRYSRDKVGTETISVKVSGDQQ